MSYELAIFNGDRVMIPMTLDGITLEWTRQGAPGKITFTVVKDEYLSFQEGSVVRLTVDDTIIFKGFVFEKSRDREQHIKVVAYDQLRYFKNKDTFKIKSQKASEFLKFVTEAFLLKPGDIEDTGFVIENHLADNKTIFDAVQDALDLTLINTGRMYVLFDDAGKICLRDCDKMQSDLLICSQTAENFDYSSSIEEMYNVVKLVRKHKDKDTVGETFFNQDENSVNRYGALQFYDNNFSETSNPEMISKRILELYNRVRRKLTIKGTFGDPAVRGGTSVFIDLALGDQNVKWRAVVDHVTHKFNNDHHTMDLQLMGKELR